MRWAAESDAPLARHIHLGVISSESSPNHLSESSVPKSSRIIRPEAVKKPLCGKD